MADKLYHIQPCFCIPCRVLRATPPKKPSASDTMASDEAKKPKAKRKRP
jgi:hypothetical protein